MLNRLLKVNFLYL